MTATAVDAIAAVTGREDLGGVTVAIAVGTTTAQRPHRRRNLLLHPRPHLHRLPMTMTATAVDDIAAVTGREDLGGVTVATAVGTTTAQRPHRRRNLLLHPRPHPHRLPTRMTATVVDAIAAVTGREDLGGVTVATAVGTTTALRPHRRRNLLLHPRLHPHRLPMRMTATAEDATVAVTGRAVLAGVTVATAVGTTTARRPHRRRNPLLHLRPRPHRLQMRRTATGVDSIAVGTASLMGDAMARGITVRTQIQMEMDRTGRTRSRPICWICRMAGATVGKVVRKDRDPDGVSVTT
jgi:putative N-acetylmannosamine-6-phosphate epimerase